MWRAIVLSCICSGAIIIMLTVLLSLTFIAVEILKVWAWSLTSSSLVKDTDQYLHKFDKLLVLTYIAGLVMFCSTRSFSLSFISFSYGRIVPRDRIIDPFVEFQFPPQATEICKSIQPSSARPYMVVVSCFKSVLRCLWLSFLHVLECGARYMSSSLVLIVLFIE